MFSFELKLFLPGDLQGRWQFEEIVQQYSRKEFFRKKETNPRERLHADVFSDSQREKFRRDLEHAECPGYSGEFRLVVAVRKKAKSV